MAGVFAESDPSAPASEDSGDQSIASESVNIVAQNFQDIWQPMLQEVWKQEIVTNMILKVPGKEFKVHRLVMLIYSTSLRRKIALADPQETCLEVSLDLDAAMMKKALEFMYCGRVEVARTQLQPLIDVTHILGINSLWKLLVLEQLQGTEVTEENCLSVWELASKAGHEELAKESKAVALKKFPSVHHSAEFKTLSDKLVLEYLADKDLVTQRPEERFLAAVRWVEVDVSSRHRHLCPVLDRLPLENMGWFLDHALEFPIIQNSSEASQIIKQAKERMADNANPKDTNPTGDQKPKPDTKKVRVPSHLMPETPVSKSPSPHHYLILTGHTRRNISNEVVAVNLSQNYQCVSLGEIKAKFDYGTNCCVKGEHLYITALGQDQRQIWKFHLQLRSASLVKSCRLKTPRQHHGMTAHHTGHLYIVGGCNPSDSLSSIATVEDIDLAAGTRKVVGRLKDYDCPCILRTCELKGGDLAVVGAKDSHDHTTCTIQLWSPSTASTTASMGLGRDVGWVYGVIEIGSHIIIVADAATVVCKVEDIINHRPHNVTISDKYQAPNKGCAVVLTPDDNIVLLGGQKRGGGSVASSVYMAPVNDIINNTRHRWKPLDTQCTLGNFYIHGYDTTYCNTIFIHGN